MYYSNSTKMNMLQQVQRGETIPSTWLNDFVLLELLDDHLVSRINTREINLTYLGLKTLEEWDPVLGVNISNHLLYPAHGDA